VEKSVILEITVSPSVRGTHLLEAELEAGMTAERTMNILIVDDYSSMLRLLRNLLQQLGFTNVFDATDGEKALEIMRENDVGLVISDWNMEPMNGFQLLREMRADSGLKDIPFIMVTAEGSSSNVIAAKDAGVTNFIVKPFNAETLRSKMVSIFGEF
jgi:two-component system chemotaxis response regulator CheY